MNITGIARIFNEKEKERSGNIAEEEDVEDDLKDLLIANDKSLIKFDSFWIGIQQGLTAAERKAKDGVALEERYFAKKPAVKFHAEFLQADHNDLNSLHLFSPDGLRKLLWDLTMGLCILYVLVTVPLLIGFNLQQSERERGVEVFLTTVFTLDILFSFNTAYREAETERLVTSRYEIAQQYLRGFFLSDAISAVPFDLIYRGTLTLSALRLLRCTRLFRLVKIYRALKISDMMEPYIHPSLLNLTWLLLQIFYIAHLFACFWYYIALPHVSDRFLVTWHRNPVFSYPLETLREQYICSMYFIVVTMLTIGYGDILPYNQLERVYAMITMFTGVVVVGSLVGKVAAIIVDRASDEKLYKASMDRFKSNLLDSKVPLKVTERAKIAYDYYLHSKASIEESMIYAELPRPIQRQLVLSLYSEVIALFAFFRLVDSSVLVDIMLQLRPGKAFSGELLYEQGDLCAELIFVKEGEVEVSVRTPRFRDAHRRVYIGLVQEGGYLGDAEWFMKSTCLCRYSVRNFANFFVLSHSVMLKALKRAPVGTVKLPGGSGGQQGHVARQVNFLGEFLQVTERRYERLKHVIRTKQLEAEAELEQQMAAMHHNHHQQQQQQRELLLHPIVHHPQAQRTLRMSVGGSSSSSAAPLPAAMAPPPPPLPLPVPIHSRKQQLLKKTDVLSRLIWVDGHLVDLEATTISLEPITGEQSVSFFGDRYQCLDYVLQTSPLVNNHQRHHSLDRGSIRRRGSSHSRRASSYYQLESSQRQQLASSSSYLELPPPSQRKRLRDQVMTAWLTWLWSVSTVSRQLATRKEEEAKKAEEGEQEEEGGAAGRARNSNSNGNSYHGSAAATMTARQHPTHRPVTYRYHRLTAQYKLQTLQCTLKEIHHRGLFLHHEPRRVVWDGVLGMAILISVLWVPPQLAFDTGKAEPLPQIVLGLLIDVVFGLDVLVVCNTTYFSAKHDALVVARSMLLWRYVCSGWFAVDVLSALPVELLEFFPAINQGSYLVTSLLRFVRLFRIARIVKVLKLQEQLTQLETYFNLSPAVLGLFTLLVRIFFIAHWTACLWWGLSRVLSQHPWFEDTGPSGMVYGSLTGDDVSDEAQYLVALYFMVTTFTTVGYGDIHPVNAAERVLVLLMGVLGVMVFGYMISAIGGIFSALTTSDDRFKERIANVRLYLKAKHCPPALSVLILNQYQRKLQELSNEDLLETVKVLPPNTAQAVLRAVYQPKLSKIAIFPYIQNVSIQLYLFRQLTPVLCDEGYLICKEGKQAKELAFLLSGSAVLYRQTPHATQGQGGQGRRHAQYGKNHRHQHFRHHKADLHQAAAMQPPPPSSSGKPAAATGQQTTDAQVADVTVPSPTGRSLVMQQLLSSNSSPSFKSRQQPRHGSSSKKQQQMMSKQQLQLQPSSNRSSPVALPASPHSYHDPPRLLEMEDYHSEEDRDRALAHCRQPSGELVEAKTDSPWAPMKEAGEEADVMAAMQQEEEEEELARHRRLNVQSFDALMHRSSYRPTPPNAAAAANPVTVPAAAAAVDGAVDAMLDHTLSVAESVAILRGLRLQLKHLEYRQQLDGDQAADSSHGSNRRRMSIVGGGGNGDGRKAHNPHADSDDENEEAAADERRGGMKQQQLQQSAAAGGRHRPQLGQLQQQQLLQAPRRRSTIFSSVSLPSRYGGLLSSSNPAEMAQQLAGLLMESITSSSSKKDQQSATTVTEAEAAAKEWLQLERAAPAERLRRYCQATKRALYMLTLRDFADLDLDYLGELYAGEFTGHFGFLDEEESHRVSAVVTRPSVIYTLSKTDVMTLLSNLPSVGFELQTALIRATLHQNRHHELKRQHKELNDLVTFLRCRFLGERWRHLAVIKQLIKESGCDPCELSPDSIGSLKVKVHSYKHLETALLRNLNRRLFIESRSSEFATIVQAIIDIGALKAQRGSHRSWYELTQIDLLIADKQLTTMKRLSGYLKSSHRATYLEACRRVASWDRLVLESQPAFPGDKKQPLATKHKPHHHPHKKADGEKAALHGAAAFKVSAQAVVAAKRLQQQLSLSKISAIGGEEKLDEAQQQTMSTPPIKQHKMVRVGLPNGHRRHRRAYSLSEIDLIGSQSMEVYRRSLQRRLEQQQQQQVLPGLGRTSNGFNAAGGGQGDLSAAAGLRTASRDI